MQEGDAHNGSKAYISNRLQLNRAALVPAPRPHAFGAGFDSLILERLQSSTAVTHIDSPRAAHDAAIDAWCGSHGSCPLPSPAGAVAPASNMSAAQRSGRVP
jgi:hypothetical protein